MTIKEQAIKNLEDFAEAAFDCQVKFMLMAGTLLGAHREQDFIINDEKDIDLGIMDRYFPLQYNCLVRHLQQKGFKQTKDVIINNEKHGGAFVRGANHIDIMRMFEKGDYIMNYGLRGKLYYIYTPDLFDGYDKITFHGHEYRTPKNIDKFLTQRYGDWKTPVPLKKYSWRGKKYSPNVRWTNEQK